MTTPDELLKELIDVVTGPQGTWEIIERHFTLEEAFVSKQWGDPIPALEPYLTHPDWQIAQLARHLLFRLDLDRAVAITLERMAESEHEFVSVYDLATLGATSAAVLPLVDVLQTSQDASTRYITIEALEQCGNERALAALEHARLHDDGCDWEERPIRKMAAKVIAAINARLAQDSA